MHPIFVVFVKFCNSYVLKKCSALSSESKLKHQKTPPGTTGSSKNIGFGGFLVAFRRQLGAQVFLPSTVSPLSLTVERDFPTCYFFGSCVEANSVGILARDL